VLDAIFFEKRGIPAAVLITEPFVPTAVGMAKLAGMPGYPHAVIAHPVGSLNRAEVRQRAEAVVAAVETMLLRAEVG
jgi:polysaccharide pyruvyl transferase WcaK-like protein